MERNADFLKLH